MACQVFPSSDFIVCTGRLCGQEASWKETGVRSPPDPPLVVLVLKSPELSSLLYLGCPWPETCFQSTTSFSFSQKVTQPDTLAELPRHVRI